MTTTRTYSTVKDKNADIARLIKALGRQSRNGDLSLTVSAVALVATAITPVVETPRPHPRSKFTWI